MSRIRILIADDHPAVREGLALVLGYEPDMEVAAFARDGEAAVAAARLHRVDIALLDMRLPRLSGVAAIHAMRARAPAARIVVLSTCTDRPLVNAALAAGAHAYVGKHSATDELLRVIREVHAMTIGERLRLDL